MKRADACIDNYLNGNLTDACELARRCKSLVLYEALRSRYGKTEAQAIAIIAYLRKPSQEAFNAACQRESDRNAMQEFYERL